MFYQVFLWPRVTRGMIISNRNGIYVLYVLYVLPLELLSDLNLPSKVKTLSILMKITKN